MNSINVANFNIETLRLEQQSIQVVFMHFFDEQNLDTFCVMNIIYEQYTVLSKMNRLHSFL